jgi:tetratricopeptide (TPR) repeat protein
LGGRTLLVKGDHDKAAAEFDKIIGLKANTAGAARLQTLSKAGKAVALAKSGKGKEGLKLVDALVEKLNPTDVEMAARIYNAQGDSYAASGDDEGAILAYLHTHLMFSTEPSAHAEALTRLVELWPKVGKPERAAEARQELQTRYPGFAK